MSKVFAAFTMMVAIAAASCGAERERVAATSDAPSSSAPPPDSGAMRSLEPIPEPFWGRWNGEHQSCTRLSTDVDVMYLEPGKIIFWDSVAQVRDAAAIDNSRLFLNLEYYEHGYSGDANLEDRGTTQLREMSLALSADQRTLTVIDSGKSVQVRHRCPSAGATDKAPE